MYVIQISDKRTFVDAATKHKLPVTVVVTSTAVAIDRGGALFMHPAQTCDFALEFENSTMGRTRWTHREVLLVDEQGRVDTRNSLLGMLQSANPSPALQVLTRLNCQSI